MLIEFVRSDLGFWQVGAETDDDAVEFYKSCGFAVESLGANSYGANRYKCLWQL